MSRTEMTGVPDSSNQIAEGNTVALCANLDVRLAAPDPVDQVFDDIVRRSAQGALPNDCDTPIRRQQGADCGDVPLLVSSQLEFPKLSSRLRKLEQGASVMPVPKAAVDKHHGTPARQYEVRPTWKGSTLKTVSETRVPKQLAHLQLGAGVPPPNSRHQCRALFSAHHINH